MKISSVYIVKNEEKNIEKSINSIKNICDEIIIVDTGSNDNTIKICENLGCKIYNYKWENDFSKARNYAISLCSNEIIIFLDADEYFTQPLEELDKQEIENYFTKEIDALGIYEIDIDKNTNEQHHTSYAFKIIKNKLKYVGSIHEYLTRENGEKIRVCLMNDKELVHTGYSSDISKSKVERNLEILNLIENKNTMDYFYLGRENLSLQNYEEAIKNFDLFFSRPDYDSEIKSNNIAYLSYIYKFHAMQNLTDKYTDSDMLEHLLKAQAKIPYIPEIYFNLGEYYYTRDFKKSLEYFDKTLKKNEEFNSSHFELNNFLGYQHKIYYYKAKIFEYMDKKNEAIQRAIVACMLNKKDVNNFSFLLHLLNRQKTKENIDLINRIYKPNSKEDYEFIVKGLENTNLYFEFLNYSLIYNQEYKGGVDSLYYAMMLNGDYEQALESLIAFNNDKRNFIMSIILLYSNDGDLFAKYADYLPEEYMDILQNILFQQNFEKEIKFDLFVNIVCKLIIYGIGKIDFKIWDYLLTNATESQIIKIISIYSNNQDYEQAIELLKYCIYDLHKYSDSLIREYLILIYNFKNYKNSNQTNYEYFISEYNNLIDKLENKNICISFLTLIRNKLITKSYLKMKNKLLREMRKYA